MRIYYDTISSVAFIVDDGHYRKLGLYRLTGRRFLKHQELDSDWTKASGYRVLPDLYAILIGDKCEV